jgi:hypothetical protein
MGGGGENYRISVHIIYIVTYVPGYVVLKAVE